MAGKVTVHPSNAKPDWAQSPRSTIMVLGVAAAIKGGQANPQLLADLVKLARQHQRAQAKVKSFSSNAKPKPVGIWNPYRWLDPVGLPAAQPGAPASPLKHWCSWRT